MRKHITTLFLIFGIGFTAYSQENKENVSFFLLFHIKICNQKGGKDDEAGAENGEKAEGLAKKADPHQKGGDGLYGTEDGASLSANEKGSLLEKHHRPRRDQLGKQKAKKPAEKTLRKLWPSGEKAHKKSRYGADEGHQKAENKA